MKKIKNQKKILIIDDNIGFLSTIVQYLENQGFLVVTALDGLDIFTLIESETYDLVITDVDMPVLSGVGVILTHKEKKPEIPIIAISGYGKTALGAAREAGADVIIDKPFRYSVLMKHIDKLLVSS